MNEGITDSSLLLMSKNNQALKMRGRFISVLRVYVSWELQCMPAINDCKFSRAQISILG
jgi:hypothetical protein